MSRRLTHTLRNSRDRLRLDPREGTESVNDQGAFRCYNTSERRKRKNAPYAPQLVCPYAARKTRVFSGRTLLVSKQRLFRTDSLPRTDKSKQTSELDKPLDTHYR